MLRDAALLQLDLSRAALAEGVLTKDATSYNVQFDGSRPVFIDVGSFERLVPGEPWAGLPPVLRAVPQPALPAGRGRHPVPAVAARAPSTGSPPPSPPPPSGSASGSAATCSPTCASTPGPRPTTPTPTPAATCGASSKRAGLRTEDHRRADGQPAAGRGAAGVEGGGLHLVELQPARPLHRRRPRRQGRLRGRAPPRPSTRPWCSTSAPTTGASRAWRSRPARRSPSPSTATTSWSTTSTGSFAARASAASCPSSSTSPIPSPAWAGARGSGRRSSTGCGPTSCCASPSSTTSP